MFHVAASHTHSTVILEIFAVVNNLRLKETAKIKHSKFIFHEFLQQQILQPLETTTN